MIGANEGGTASGGDDERRGGMGGTTSSNWQAAALLAIESAHAPKSKIPKENSPVLYELPTCYHVAVVSISRGVDVEDSRQNLEMSVRRKNSRPLTLDVVSQCGRCGVVETESDC